MTKAVTLPPFIDYALIIQIATAVSHSREWGKAIDQKQAFELAYDAINSHVMRGEVGDNPPRFLWFIGRRAVRSYLASRIEVSLATGGTAVDQKRIKPRFAKYWLEHEVQDPVAEVDERVALHQALDGLEPEQRKDLEALAATFDGAEAAKLRGVGRVHFVKRCRRAREAFFALWFEGETMPALPKRVVNRA